MIGRPIRGASYKALMLLLEQLAEATLGYQISYVLSKAEGNVDNTGFGNWLQGTHLELSEHRAHQHVRRADELAASRDQGVRGLPAFRKWTSCLARCTTG